MLVISMESSLRSMSAIVYHAVCVDCGCCFFLAGQHSPDFSLAKVSDAGRQVSETERGDGVGGGADDDHYE